MRYEYWCDDDASKKYRIDKISGLPKNINFKFTTFYIRFFKSREYNGYFSSSMAIPAFQDDDGYVFEQKFSDYNFSEESFSDYEVAFNEHNIDSISDSISCTFEYKKEMGRGYILCKMLIKGTSFCGHVLLDDRFFEEEILIKN